MVRRPLDIAAIAFSLLRMATVGYARSAPQSTLLIRNVRIAGGPSGRLTPANVLVIAGKISPVEPFKAMLDGDMKALAGSGEKGLAQLIITTLTGMTTDEFAKSVADWLTSAQHPRSIRASSNLIPTWCSSRYRNCLPICAKTASRPTSVPGYGRVHACLCGARSLERKVKP